MKTGASLLPQITHRNMFLVQVAATASFAVALLLIIAKFWAVKATQSVSLEATLVDSLLDALASLGNLWAVKKAQRPADKDHRFGHGKLEAIAALLQSLLIFLSGLWLIKESVYRFFYPQPLEQAQLGMAVIAFAIVATGSIVAFQRYVVRRTNSLAIAADSAHYKTDFVINVGVLATLYFGNQVLWLDALSCGLISLYIIHSCWGIFHQALNILTDRELADETRKKIRDIIFGHPHVVGLHDMRTRSSGYVDFIQAHVEMPPHLSLQEAHDIADSISDEIMRHFPNTDVLIHIDPPYEKSRRK